MREFASKLSLLHYSAIQASRKRCPRKSPRGRDVEMMMPPLIALRRHVRSEKLVCSCENVKIAFEIRPARKDVKYANDFLDAIAYAKRFHLIYRLFAAVRMNRPRSRSLTPAALAYFASRKSRNEWICDQHALAWEKARNRSRESNTARRSSSPFVCERSRRFRKTRDASRRGRCIVAVSGAGKSDVGPKMEPWDAWAVGLGSRLMVSGWPWSWQIDRQGIPFALLMTGFQHISWLPEGAGTRAQPGDHYAWPRNARLTDAIN